MIDYKKSLALNIYRRLTGDMETQFDNTEDIWTEIDRELAGNDGTVNIEELDVRYTSNGEYVFESTDEVTAYAPVKIEVDCPVGFSFGEIGYDEELSDLLNSQTLRDIEYTKSLEGKIESATGYSSLNTLFKDDINLVYAPNGVISPHCVQCYQTFNGCSNLKCVPLYNTSNIEYMGDSSWYYGMFSGCSSLISVPLFDTSKVTNMGQMFSGCSSLISVPLFDTSKVTNMDRMFSNCRSLTSVPLFDTSKVTNMGRMFYNCKSLEYIPDFDTSNVTTMIESQMGPFAECTSLKAIPNWDFSKITDWEGMFYNCKSITTIPQIDMSNAKDIYHLFYGCNSLTDLPLLDWSSLGGSYNMSRVFDGCTNLTNLGGFKDFGKRSDNSQTLSIDYSTKLTHESLMNVINNLYDRTSAGYSVAGLSFGSTNLAKLTDEEKAIATNKGWILS